MDNLAKQAIENGPHQIDFYGYDTRDGECHHFVVKDVKFEQLSSPVVVVRRGNENFHLLHYILVHAFIAAEDCSIQLSYGDPEAEPRPSHTIYFDQLDNDSLPFPIGSPINLRVDSWSPVPCTRIVCYTLLKPTEME